jgi:O-methyltransferase
MKARNKELLARLLVPRYVEALEKANYYALFRSWMKASMAGVHQVPTRTDLVHYIVREVLSERPIDYLEFGVYRGASISVWMNANKSPDSRFFGFDSFTGLPEDWIPGFEKGTFDLGGQAPEISDARLRLLVGDFRETLPPFLEAFTSDRNLIIHIDCDLYSSAMYCLASTSRIVRNGSIIIFDEFSVPLHEFRAFLDYCSVFQPVLLPIATVGRNGEAVALRAGKPPAR